MVAPLSDFDEMKKERLPNWGRWGRQDSDKPHDDSYSICAAYTRKGDEAADEAPVPPAPPIKWRDAETLDGYIRQLFKTRHYRVIREHYYLMNRTHLRDDVDAAVRAVLDLIYANQATIKRMRSVGA